MKHTDKVEQPSHYMRNEPDPATYAMRNGLEFWQGNVLKYVLRAGYKQYEGLDVLDSEITDLKKAKRYIEMRINLLEGKETL